MPRKGTSPASPLSAQQLGNGAIVELLCSGRSFFGVRARGEGSKGYAEKGAPTKKSPVVQVWQRPAPKTDRSANEPAETQMGLKLGWPLSSF